QIAPEYAPTLPRIDQPPEQPRTEHAADAGADRIEEGDRKRPHFEGKRLTDGKIGGARSGRGEEEDYGPGDGLSRGRECAGRKQIAGSNKQQPGNSIRESNHHPATERVEEPPEQHRSQEISRRKR